MEPKPDLRQDIYASDIIDLQEKIVYVLKNTGAVMYDECTGNYMVKYGRIEAICPEKDAMTHFRTIFGTHCFIKKTKMAGDGPTTSIEKAGKDVLNDIFLSAAKVLSFNSRQGFYDSIPEWDGVKRVDTCLKDLLDCDANPNLFWLFLTSCLGKIKDPKNYYVPFFFDLVGNKGVGKSLFCVKLFGDALVQELQPCSRPEDIYTQVYQYGFLIAIDDELKITGRNNKKFNSWSHDDLKAFVTCRRDTFSRKGMQLEVHPRAFVFVRTSNTVKISTEPDERRQIIFESNLPANHCRLFDYDEDYYAQILAEGKNYLEKNGLYVLTKDDWGTVHEQQGDYVDTENTNYTNVADFIEKQINLIKMHSSEIRLEKEGTLYYFSWKDFYDYWTFDRGRSPENCLNGVRFWSLVDEYIMTNRGVLIKGTRYLKDRTNHKKKPIAFINIDSESI